MAVIVKLLSKFDDSGLKKAKSGFGGLQKTLGAVGIGLGLGQIANFATNAMKGFEQAEIASSKLATVLENMGMGQATQRVDAYAESLQDLTAVDADVIKAAQRQLATFSFLSDTADVAGSSFDRATKAALDLAATFGGDATSKAVALGKAMQDPIKGIASLRRSGVDFTKAEKDKIKTLVESGNILEAQDKILKVIEKQVGGTAEAGASVFDRMKLSMDSVSDELGSILLPYMKDFADFLMNNVVPNVKSFLEDVSNPDTEAGKTFLQIKDAVEQTYNGVRDFFALFGDGDAMKGFGNVATELVKALPALLALKGILMLASAGKSIANLAKAIGLMTGAGAVDGVVGGGKGGKGKGGGLPLLGTGALIGVGAVLSTSGDTKLQTPEEQAQRIAEINQNKRDLFKNAGTFPGLPSRPVTNNITINVPNADPKATVDAVGKYLKQNGSLPFNLATAGKKP